MTKFTQKDVKVQKEEVLYEGFFTMKKSHAETQVI